MNKPPPESNREAQIRAHVHRQAEFYKHLMSFVLVNLGLWAINAAQIFTTSQKYWWAIFPTLGWGIGVLAHWAAVFIANNESVRNWEERKVTEMIERELRK